MPISIQQLIHGQLPLVKADVNDSLQSALDIMIANDFSQLPAMENGKLYRNKGSLITSDSIVRALRAQSSSLDGLRVRDAVVDANVIAADDDLFSKIDGLFNAPAHLVTDAQRDLVGIVTNYDTAQYFRIRALDMLLAENIETALKGHLREAYRNPNDEGALERAVKNLATHQGQARENCRKALTGYCGRSSLTPDQDKINQVLNAQFPEADKNGDFDKLSLDQYITLACNEEAWGVLVQAYNIPKDNFSKMLHGVRETRNKLAHFNPNVSPTERERLRYCSNWFNNHPFENPLTDEREIDQSSGGAMQTSETKVGEGENEVAHPTDGNGDEESGTNLQETLSEEPTEEEVSLIEDEETPDEVVAESVEAKYAPLAAFLLKQPIKFERLPLSFEKIEDIVGARLPDAARENRSWWDNNPQSQIQSSQWLKVNWRVISVNMTTQKVTFGRAHERAKTYIAFFSGVQELLKERSQFPLLDANPLGINWLPLHKFVCPFPSKPTIVLSFAHHSRLRLELYIDCGDTDKNAKIFRHLQDQSQTLESAMGAALSWQLLEGKRACRIAIYTQGSIENSPEQKEQLTRWAVENATRFYEAIRNPLQEVLNSFQIPLSQEIPQDANITDTLGNEV